jgi:RNA polymerase sigma-70 factor, ECF subfamily
MWVRLHITPVARRDEFEGAALPCLDDLYRTAMHLTRDPARAQDAVQETYLQAWKSFARFESGTNCRAWLFKILFHTVQHQRRWWSRWVQADDEQQLDRLPATPPLPDQLSDKEVLTALEHLPAEFRAVILLVDVEDFAYKEAAGILGVPIGTVMSRLSRARGLLRKDLAGAAGRYGIRAKGGA